MSRFKCYSLEDLVLFLTLGEQLSTMKDLFYKQTVVQCWWGGETQKFDIKQVEGPYLYHKRIITKADCTILTNLSKYGGNSTKMPYTNINEKNNLCLFFSRKENCLSSANY